MVVHGLISSAVAATATAAVKESKTGIGSRRIFPPQFKLQVLDSYRNDTDCKGNQRATARKYGIHRRQIQKWLQAENHLRNSVVGTKTNNNNNNNNKDAVIGSSNIINTTSSYGAFSATTGCDSKLTATITTTTTVDLALNNSNTSSSSSAGNFVECRQRDDATAIDATTNHCCANNNTRLPLPTLSPASTTSSESTYSTGSPIPRYFNTPVPQPDYTYPMDLSVKKNGSNIVDLSTRKRSAETENPKPVKLFKPYLDDISETKKERKVSPSPINTYPPYNYHIYEPSPIFYPEYDFSYKLRPYPTYYHLYNDDPYASCKPNLYSPLKPEIICNAVKM